MLAKLRTPEQLAADFTVIGFSGRVRGGPAQVGPGGQCLRVYALARPKNGRTGLISLRVVPRIR